MEGAGKNEIRFPSDEKFGLNFWKLPMSNGRVYSGISKKKRQPREVYTYFSLMPYAESPFHLNFLPEFPELSVEWFTFGKFNKFFTNVLPGISIPFEFPLGISGISRISVE